MNKKLCTCWIFITVSTFVIISLSFASDLMKERAKLLMSALKVEEIGKQQTPKQLERIRSVALQRVGSFSVKYGKKSERLDGVTVTNLEFVSEAGKTEVVGRVIDSKSSQSTRTDFFEKLAMNSMPMDMLIRKYTASTDEIGDLYIFERTYNKKIGSLVVENSSIHFIRNNIAVSLHSKNPTIDLQDLVNLIKNKLH